MKVYTKDQSREEYFNTQIIASKRKFSYCKVSTNCVLRWRDVLKKANSGNIPQGPIVCMGTRNGRELDLFRIFFFGIFFRSLLVRLLEVRRYAFSSRLSLVESWGTSDINNIDRNSVVGVELNVQGKRKDVYIGSFDDLPSEWSSKFNIVYANTLDHAQDPSKAAKEWYRVLAPGGYLIIGYPGEDINASLIDNVGNIDREDILSLFPGELVYFNRFGNCFQEVIIRKKSNNHGKISD